MYPIVLADLISQETNEFLICRGILILQDESLDGDWFFSSPLFAIDFSDLS